MKNAYLEQVQQSTSLLEEDLKVSAAHLSPMSARGGGGARGGGRAPAVEVRVTGFWRWQSVVVPPNALVVHTRRGHKEPLHCGLGLSFRFNPYTDAFLAVPAAMQTLIINANCICKERQGVVVQAYLQWEIDDFALAYRKLDLSDPYEPMRVTNAQLRQQAEATVKDTVAGMGIDEVLADKQPIMVELTRRLREVAEGREGKEGLGLRIVTVQIKEAIVSSSALWESLQRSFRAEREEVARLAELESASRVEARQREEVLVKERAEQARKQEMARLKAQVESESFDLAQRERARRAEVEAANAVAMAAQEEVTLKAREALKALEAQAAREEAARALEAELLEARARLALEAERVALAQNITPEQLRERLISLLPQIARELPKPTELRVYEGGQGAQVAQLVEGLMGALERAARGAGEVR